MTQFNEIVSGHEFDSNEIQDKSQELSFKEKDRWVLFMVGLRRLCSPDIGTPGATLVYFY